MRSYENNAVKWKKRTVIVLSLALLAAGGHADLGHEPAERARRATVSEDVDVTLQLPDTPAEGKGHPALYGGSADRSRLF